MPGIDRATLPRGYRRDGASAASVVCVRAAEGAFVHEV